MRNYIVPPVPSSVWHNPLHFIAFGFGSGAIPKAPGTFGTLMAIPFYLTFQSVPNAIYILIVALIAILSTWICNKTSKDIGIEDHQGMCLDEFVGFFVTMFNAPLGWSWILVGFLLFRLFDIWKPWPINIIDERVKGGFGMILDDVLAGVYANIVLQILIWLY